MKKFIVGGYLVTLAGLFLYSFTQIDLSLTFSRIDFLRELVKNFQYIGYFNRPLSSFLYILLVVFLFNFYLGILVAAHAKMIDRKTVWRLVIATACVLVFSYNAFSHDLFNYIFDAKIVTYYQQNPYEHKALDFTGDPMLSFMHWTHRVYPYGPVWLGLTVPLSFIGFNFFLPTFGLFKILMALSFLGTIHFLGKISDKISPDKTLFIMSFFAFNPLVVIESLVSAHNDIVMIFFACLAIYHLMTRKYLFSYGALGLSAGIKFVSGLLIPVFLITDYLRFKKKKVNWNYVLYSMIILMIAGVVYVSSRTNYQPWYLLNVLFIGALLSYRFYVFIPLAFISLVSLFNYVPYLYLGNWDPPVPDIISSMNVSAVILSVIIVVVYYFSRKRSKIRIKNSI